MVGQAIAGVLAYIGRGMGSRDMGSGRSLRQPDSVRMRGGGYGSGRPAMDVCGRVLRCVSRVSQRVTRLEVNGSAHWANQHQEREHDGADERDGDVGGGEHEEQVDLDE